MEFESPDVERDFPGLYASEASKKSNDSDFSDESYDSKLSKKDLLIGKRKDKKDRGYATLEGESSPDEEVDLKSPSKSKKSKPFKFSTKHKKEKESKEVEKEKDAKKKDKDKHSKTKERKKVKSGDAGDIADEQPIFGVSLEVANQRCPCHDGVNIPLVVRECIDFVESCGLNTEQVYKVSGIKSKVQHLKLMYNKREPPLMNNFDVPVITSLLKLFLRELPEPILTSELLNKFEDVASVKDITVREGELKRLVEKLMPVNKMVLAWLLTHFNHVSSQEKGNKMSSQNIASVMSPVLQMSQKLLSALLFHCESILPPVEFQKYIPPLSSTSPCLPETGPGIHEELKKQDSLLTQLHAEMNAGFVSKQREEQLWEVQRIITQLKRKLRTLEKGASSGSMISQRSVEETDSVAVQPKSAAESTKSAAESMKPAEAVEDEFSLNLNLQKVKADIEPELTPEATDKKAEVKTIVENVKVPEVQSHPQTNAVSIVQTHPSLVAQTSAGSMVQSHPSLVAQTSSGSMVQSHPISVAQTSTGSMVQSHPSLVTQTSTGSMVQSHPSLVAQTSAGSIVQSHPSLVAQASTGSMVQSHPSLVTQTSTGSIQSGGVKSSQAGPGPLSSASTSPLGSIQSSLGSELCEPGVEDEDTGSTLSEGDFILKGLKLESAELLTLASTLQENILDEKLQIATLQQKILSHPNFNNNTDSLPTTMILDDGEADPTSELVKETRRLEIQKENLIRSIIKEREIIIDLKVQILMKQGSAIPAM